jgi:intracellular multiplication protein IcmL
MSQVDKSVFIVRNRYRGLMRWIVFFSLSALILLALNIAFFIMRPDPKYYATTANGRIFGLHPLSQPVMTDSRLIQWTSIAVRNALTVDFLNSASQLARVKPYFSAGGWNRFEKALNQSGFIKTVEGKKLEVNAVVSSPPVILATDVIGGRFTWRVQLPLLLTFTSASQTVQPTWMAVVDVQRVSTQDSSEGIQIIGFDVSQQGG